MNENTITTEQIQAMKTLADTNMKISEATNLLFNLQEEETEYLILREKKATARIQQNLEDSRSVIEETNQNHQAVKELFTLASGTVEKITSLYELFQETVKDFNTKNEAWEREIGFQSDALVDMKNNLKIELVMIENDRKTVEREKKSIENDYKIIESQRAQIKSALATLSKKHG